MKEYYGIVKTSDDIRHWKYTSREWKNGHWVYTYEDETRDGMTRTANTAQTQQNIQSFTTAVSKGASAVKKFLTWGNAQIKASNERNYQQRQENAKKVLDKARLAAERAQIDAQKAAAKAERHAANYADLEYRFNNRRGVR